MLVLTRRIDQSIVIGEDGIIEITIVEIRGNTVHIGITAPKELSIDRSEIAALKKAKGKAVAKQSWSYGTGIIWNDEQ